MGHSALLVLRAVSPGSAGLCAWLCPWEPCARALWPQPLPPTQYGHLLPVLPKASTPGEGVMWSTAEPQGAGLGKAGLLGGLAGQCTLSPTRTVTEGHAC